MNIFDLNYLEVISKASGLRGANSDCSIEISIVDGKVKEKVSGCPVKKEVKKEGSTTTYTYEGDNTFISISVPS